ncbi:segregation/condensation protein A [Candidatus Woesearchaeota archaeon]|nr:segregation/condensation protein A [Candidatus Woesearchaeota archaeon]
MNSQDKIFKVIFDSDEVTWQRILYELVKSEEMDPWDIDISTLTQRYIKLIKEMKETDFRVSGKVLLAAAILLKIKSTRLLNEDLSDFDRLLIEPTENLPDELDLEDYEPKRGEHERVPLIPKTPQPRKRKVSIYDLVASLEQALEVKKRRVLNSIPPMHMEAPKKTRDVTEVIREVYGKIRSLLYKSDKKTSFSQIVPSDSREDKVYTFIPLLHLNNQQKISIEQEEAFGDIDIYLRSKKDVDKELQQEA